MRRCLTWWTCSRALRRPLPISGLRGATLSPRNFAARSRTHPDDTASQSTGSPSLKYDVLKRISFPERDEKRNPAAWASLLEPGLPPHLRESDDTKTNTSLNASDIVEILLAAQSQISFGTTIDLLFHLGIEKGRWRAVVWLVKHLVETFAPAHSKPGRLSKTLCSWAFEKSLDEVTTDAINAQELGTPPADASISATNLHSLEELTDDLKPERLSRESLLWHDALGSIWRSLGVMTIECADGEIRPEILEIIAHLHHMEIMPASIYNQKPSADPTAIQQPLMLNLFSSRILTSLSDAAWRAHEKVVVEEAKAKGGAHVSVRPEIPGTAYRVNVAGLRPEVWLELILWSCLHGGWILQGAAILRAAYDERGGPGVRKWRPLSWRSLVDYVERDQDWDELEYLFNTRKPSARDETHQSTTISVRRTISSEVVNAYVDALLSTVRLSVGERGAAPGLVLGHLETLHKFLGRSGLALETGSWDAVVLRFLDIQEAVISQRHNFDRLIGLSPRMGEELQPDRTLPLPAYVLDGSAAVLGLFHRALRSRIHAGDVNGALRLFESLQTLADKNKHQSVVDFIQKQRVLGNSRAEPADGMFTNNFSGIEYPAFDVQIPSTILGPFLELITDAKAYDFGKWLLYSDEIDGPVLLEQHYGDPAVTPALVRFAAETNDTVLLSKLIQARSLQAQAGEPTMPRNVLLSFFESQVNLRRWDAAVRILEYMKDTQYAYWNFVSIAYVIRIMLLHVRGAEAGDQDSIQNLARAKTLLSNMVQGKYERKGERPHHVQDQIGLLLTMLSTLDRTWTEYCLNLQPLQGVYSFNLTAKAFNLVLDGVVDAYGSVAGRRLLGVFWSHSIRDAQKIGRRRSLDEAGEHIMTRFVPRILDRPGRKRTVIKIPGRPEEEVIIYGGLSPDLMTIHTIFFKAVQELKQGGALADHSTGLVSNLSPPDLESDTDEDEDIDLSPSGMIVWAIRCFRSMRMADEDIRDELDKALSEDEVSRIREQIPALFDAASNKQETVGDVEIENSEVDLETRTTQQESTLS